MGVKALSPVCVWVVQLGNVSCSEWLTDDDEKCEYEGRRRLVLATILNFSTWVVFVLKRDVN